MSDRVTSDIAIRRHRGAAELYLCAAMMAESEPWVTLGIGYNELLDMVSDPYREVYLAHVDASILGFVVVEMKGAFTGYIKSICVSSLHRGRGVGGKLMAYAEHRVFREKPNVFLCVSGVNVAAQGFYRHLGYEIVGELKDYLVSGYSEILMRKTVAPLSEFTAG